jgi:pimeloyl-ACP methyl ester carboxylesterase
MELVAFEGRDGIRYDGLFVPPRNDLTVIHVHGKCGNFYQNDFIKTMLNRFHLAGIGFLAFNHRGHDCLAEGYRYGHVEYLGGALEIFEECLIDIDAAVEFARRYAAEVVLQGHSNGSEKALYYASQRHGMVKGLVLLSPSDSYAMQRRYRLGESPKEQLGRLARMAASSEDKIELLSLDEYGIRTGNKDYPIPVSRQSLMDVLGGPALCILNLSEPSTFIADQLPTLVCVGNEDPYLTVSSSRLLAELKARVGENVVLQVIEAANHHFEHHEEALLDAIVSWCN